MEDKDPTTTGAATTEPPKSDSGANGGDDLEKLKQHNKGLLTELTNKKSKLQELETKYASMVAEKEAREAEELKQRGEFEKLYKSEQSKVEALQKQAIRAEIKAYAIKEGVIDMDVVEMIPHDKIKINESFQIFGAEEAVKAYKESKPKFFEQVAAAAADAAKTAAAAPAAKPTGAAVADPAAQPPSAKPAVKPGSPEARTAIRDYLARNFR